MEDVKLTALAAALAGRPGLAGLAGLAPAALEPLPVGGLVHRHFRPGDRCDRRIDGLAVLIRVPVASQWGLTPAEALDYEAACFRRAGPSGHVPRLLDVVPPAAGLPFGALVVEDIAGRRPRLPDDLPALATALARVHALPLPPAAARPPLLLHPDPFAGTLERIEVQWPALARAGLEPRVEQMLAAELDAVRALVREAAGLPQPVALVLTDTHPGNFLLRPDGVAIAVDLEKALYGSPAIDLAHATLATSLRWGADTDADTDANAGDSAPPLTRDDIRGFYSAWGAAAGPRLARATAPWLAPARRLTWLRTMTFAAGLRARGPQALAGLDAGFASHLQHRLEAMFTLPEIDEARAEWSGEAPLSLD